MAKLQSNLGIYITRMWTLMKNNNCRIVLGYVLKHSLLTPSEQFIYSMFLLDQSSQPGRKVDEDCVWAGVIRKQWAPYVCLSLTLLIGNCGHLIFIKPVVHKSLPGFYNFLKRCFVNFWQTICSIIV